MAEDKAVNIIIVGAGFAGLACAIESKRKGHNVTLLEKFPQIKNLGRFHLFENMHLTILAR